MKKFLKYLTAGVLGFVAAELYRDEKVKTATKEKASKIKLSIKELAKDIKEIKEDVKEEIKEEIKENKRFRFCKCK